MNRTHELRNAGTDHTRTRRLRIAVLGGVLAGVLYGGGAGAIAADDVEVTVLAIRATKSNTEVSPELKDIAEQLKKQFNFTGFKVERRTVQRVALNKRESFGLIGAFSVDVIPTARTDKDVSLKIELLKREGEKKSSVLRTSVTVRLSRFQFFGGQKLEGGDVLITAVCGK